jgi:integrase
MGRAKSAENARDPATDKPLSPGVGYRGPGQYRARKLISGKPTAKTFKTDELARDWLEENSVDVRRGDYVDRRDLDKWTVGQLVQRYKDECMQDGGDRRGAIPDHGHIPSLLKDQIADLRLSNLTPAAVRGFRDRQRGIGRPKDAPITRIMAKGTVVKRMNLLASIIAHARSEWDFPFKENVASGGLVKRPPHADKKRNRRLRVPSKAAIRLAESRGEVAPETEEQALYAVLAKTNNKFDLLMTKFAVAQATRQGEQLGLRWQDIDYEARTITLYGREGRGTKNDESQEEEGPEIRALMPAAIEILRSIEPEGGGRPEDIVFPVGDHIAFRLRWGRAVAKAAKRMKGIQKELRFLANLRFHDLRHEATSRLAKIFKESDLMKVTGHIDRKSMLRYYQPDPTELAMIAEEYELARKAGVVVPPDDEKAAAD